MYPFIALLLGSPVPADTVELPTTPPPLQVLASINKDGSIVLVDSVTEYKTVPRTRIFKTPDGKEKTETIEVRVPVVSFRSNVFPTKDVQVFDTKNNPVDVKKLPELLAKRVPALVSVDGNKVDPLHLRVVKEGTLVFVVPAWQARPVPTELPPGK
jgi:hypothetical protein